ncbi:hypothetical protein M2404_002000 [Rheinheimera pacifica]|uniref:DUF4238 domain-containing protein n=1 Tax=Rheinheimera pacifica TaxID=173990 RepID=UPI002167A40D|nr:DUF4238 domain-containing protein [Rheinheimera pacifica]MCS4307660.1 hypothetical protein [Rheinheimera pacifica]
MATNKNQHFVPRCYLKAFSKSGEGLAINLFNIDRRRLIQNAPLKHQCSKDYFYGEDQELENAIQFIEGRYGSIVKEVLSPGYRFTEDHKHFLKLFWLLQYLRTESASRRQVEMFQGINAAFGGVSDKFVPSIKEAVLHSMYVFATEMNIVSDLKACLIKNKSGVRFVTSDDPAIMGNRWHQLDKRARGMGFGLGASGLLAFLPLSENVIFMAYDGDVYSVPNNEGWAVCKNNADARAFNQFQYLNCRANIFVRNSESENELVSSLDAALPYRPKERHKINYAVLDSTEGEYKRYIVITPEEAGEHVEALVHSQPIFPVPPHWPSQITWRSKGVVYTNGTGVGYVRRNQVSEGQSYRKYWSEPAKIKT